jgi:hypothetical protein
MVTSERKKMNLGHNPEIGYDNYLSLYNAYNKKSRKRV